MGKHPYIDKNIYRVDVIADEWFNYKWDEYCEASQGEAIDPGTNQIIKEVLYNVAYAEARQFILTTKCNCE